MQGTSIAIEEQWGFSVLLKDTVQAGDRTTIHAINR